MEVRLQQKDTGLVKESKVGFSWTMFFFGIFVPLFRGDWKWFLISFLVAFVTIGFSWFVFPFFYNKLYIKDLLEKGYIPSSEADENILRSRGFIVGEKRAAN